MRRQPRLGVAFEVIDRSLIMQYRLYGDLRREWPDYAQYDDLCCLVKSVSFPAIEDAMKLYLPGYKRYCDNGMFQYSYRSPAEANLYLGRFIQALMRVTANDSYWNDEPLAPGQSGLTILPALDRSSGWARDAVSQG